MTIFSKTVRAAELPADWRRDLGIDLDRLVKVEIEEVSPVRSEAEVARLMVS